MIDNIEFFTKFCHLLHNFLDIFIGCLYNPIHLRPVGRRIVVLSLELFTEFSDHFVVEIGTIICNDPLWYTVPTDQVMSNEPCHNSLGYRSIGCCLDPLCEVIDRH